MSGIAMFVSNEEMFEQANRILNKMDHHIKIMKWVNWSDAVKETRNAMDQSAVDIIIARGRSLEEIKRYTNATTVEIVMTAQELGILVKNAKKLVGKEKPVIGLFSWGNTLCDTEYFNYLYDVELKRFVVTNDVSEMTKWPRMMEQLDFVIGGYSALDIADKMRIPSMFLSSTGESIQLAIERAETLYQVMEREKHNSAQFSAILDNSFSGIIKIGQDGSIQMVNYAMEHIMEISRDRMLGKPLNQVLRELDIDRINDVLSGDQENYSGFFHINQQTFVIVVEPIVIEQQKNEGAILSCSRLQRISSMKSNASESRHLKGVTAHGRLDDRELKLTGLKSVIERAKIYAQSSSPMLIRSELGSELELICEGIHNYGERKNGPYIVVNLEQIAQEEQEKVLFGELEDESKQIRRKPGSEGLVQNANQGSLVLKNIEALASGLQSRLLQMIKSKRIFGKNMEYICSLNVRLICHTREDISETNIRSKIQPELYYMLRALYLEIPLLRERKEDVECLINRFIKKYTDIYSQYHIVTRGAKCYLAEYPWMGGYVQLESFCERMILTVGKRTITEEYVRNLIRELYEEQSETREDEQAVSQKQMTETEMQREELLETLHACRGNRTLAAKRLGISVTTLWRRMKKYGIN